MSADWSVEDLLRRVKRKCLLPTTNPKLSDDEILEIVDEEIQSRLFPALLSVSEDYAVGHRYMVTTYGMVPLPPFASASTILDVGSVETLSGGSVPVNSNAKTGRRLPRLPSSARLEISGQDGNQYTDRPRAYCIEGERLYLLPSTGEPFSTVYVRYQRRPNRLCFSTDTKVALVDAVDTGGSEFTIDPINTTWDPVAGDLVDFISPTPGFDVPVQGLRINSAAGAPVYTYLPSDSANLAQSSVTEVDMFQVVPGRTLVVASGFTPIFPLPDVWFPVAVYAAAATVCRETGDLTQSQVLDATASRMIDAAIKMQANRVRKAPPIAMNPFSPLRPGRFRGWVDRD